VVVKNFILDGDKQMVLQKGADILLIIVAIQNFTPFGVVSIIQMAPVSDFLNSMCI